MPGAQPTAPEAVVTFASDAGSAAVVAGAVVPDGFEVTAADFGDAGDAVAAVVVAVETETGEPPAAAVSAAVAAEKEQFAA